MKEADQGPIRRLAPVATPGGRDSYNQPFPAEEAGQSARALSRFSSQAKQAVTERVEGYSTEWALARMAHRTPNRQASKAADASDSTPPEVVVAAGRPNGDLRALRDIFAVPGWRLESAPTLADTIRILDSLDVAVVICERDLPDGNWAALLDYAGMSVPPPRLIVYSRLADNYLWAEVLNLGGYDVLPAPFDAGDVRRVVSYAIDSWRRERMAAVSRGFASASSA